MMAENLVVARWPNPLPRDSYATGDLVWGRLDTSVPVNFQPQGPLLNFGSRLARVNSLSRGDPFHHPTRLRYCAVDACEVCAISIYAATIWARVPEASRNP